MSDNFACCVDELTTKGISVDSYRNDRSRDIFLEGFEQVMAHAHQIIPGCVGSKPLEGQLLMTKGFQRSVGQFIRAPIVITGQNRFCIQPLFFTDCPELGIDWLFLTKVGDDNRISA